MTHWSFETRRRLKPSRCAMEFLGENGEIGRGCRCAGGSKVFLRPRWEPLRFQISPIIFLSGMLENGQNYVSSVFGVFARATWRRFSQINPNNQSNQASTQTYQKSPCSKSKYQKTCPKITQIHGENEPSYRSETGTRLPSRGYRWSGSAAPCMHNFMQVFVSFIFSFLEKNGPVCPVPVQVFWKATASQLWEFEAGQGYSLKPRNSRVVYQVFLWQGKHGHRAKSAVYFWKMDKNGACHVCMSQIQSTAVDWCILL